MYDVDIAIDSNGTPYVGYSDEAYEGKTTVMRFDGSDRVAVGDP